MKITEHYTLELLINGCIRQEHWAQSAIYQQYAAKMFAICLRYAKNTMVAEELLQNGFVKVFKAIGQFKNLGSFEGWIKKIMVNTAIEYYRQAVKIQPMKELMDEVDFISDSGGVIEQLQVKDLLSLIAALPDGYRVVFNLYVMEGYSHKEIAAILGITEGGSKSQLSRARKLLQKAIKIKEKGAYARLEK